MLDAPICRGQRAADAGTMLTLCGGKPEVFERGKPIYGAFCKDIVLLGDVGAGQFGKAMNNFLLWVNGVALIEAGRLSEANGIDLVKLREALLISSGASDALKNWENVSFLWALKDMQIVAKMADKAGLSMPIAGAIKELVKDGRRIKQSNPPDWTGRNAKSIFESSATRAVLPLPARGGKASVSERPGGGRPARTEASPHPRASRGPSPRGEGWHCRCRKCFKRSHATSGFRRG